MEQSAREKVKKQTGIPNWRRRRPKTSRGRQNFQKIKKVFEKASAKALSTRDITSCLKHLPNFVGVFSSDQLKFVHVHSFPIFVVVNLDTSVGKGLHWLSIRISRRSVEIFDSLGFNPTLWNIYPMHLFQFLSPYRYTHNFTISPVLQPPNTFYCGAFAIFYVLYRQHNSYSNCLKLFSKNLSDNFPIILNVLFSL